MPCVPQVVEVSRRLMALQQLLGGSAAAASSSAGEGLRTALHWPRSRCVQYRSTAPATSAALACLPAVVPDPRGVCVCVKASCSCTCLTHQLHKARPQAPRHPTPPFFCRLPSAPPPAAGDGSQRLAPEVDVVWMVMRQPGLLTADFNRLTSRLLEMKVGAGVLMSAVMGRCECVCVGGGGELRGANAQQVCLAATLDLNFRLPGQLPAAREGGVG